MADKLENTLLSQNYMDMDVENDFLRAIDKNGISYKNAISDVAKLLMEDYEGTFFMGTAQTVQTAINNLNTADNSLKTRATNLEGRATSLETRATNLETCGVTIAEIEALEEALGL